MRPLALALALLATPASAVTPLTAEEFDAHFTGKTVTYRQSGSLFGIEEYLPGRKVRWSVAPGECQYGSWYPEDSSICFVYEYDPDPHCWTFWKDGDTLLAQSNSGDPAFKLYGTDSSDQPLACPGPDVGA
ncbi:MAG: hypothetical protein NTW20_08535 [Rhodobacterales bacterium]|nr:hypothetical protein [Rhodobacterales bacterium]